MAGKTQDTNTGCASDCALSKCEGWCGLNDRKQHYPNDIKQMITQRDQVMRLSTELYNDARKGHGCLSYLSSPYSNQANHSRAMAQILQPYQSLETKITLLSL